MKYYLESRYTDSGKVTTFIYSEQEVMEMEFDTTPYSQMECYDRYVDIFSTLEEAEEAEREAKGVSTTDTTIIRCMDRV